MTQVKNVQAETASRKTFGGNTVGSFPPVGSAEHLALVEAIWLNFPEIYEASEDAETGSPYGRPVARRLSVLASNCA